MNNSLGEGKKHSAGAGSGCTLVPTVIYSGCGHPIEVWTPDEMRIPDFLIDSVFYLYPSEDEAERGVALGGTGFFVGVPFDGDPSGGIIYAVSNEHVIRGKYPSPVIRLNTREGKVDTIPLAASQWLPHPDGDDLAAAMIGTLDFTVYKYRHCSADKFITPEVVHLLDIGPGDEVYMVGRFAPHEGKDRNKPAVRSGIISLMPDPAEPIECADGGNKQEGFLVEMRSLSGYSGSPVYFRFPLAQRVVLKYERDLKPEGEHLHLGPWLVGVDCGSLKWSEDVVELERQRGGGYLEKETNLIAKSHTGFSVVIPAWKLRELLDREEFVMERKKKGEEYAESKEREAYMRRGHATRDALKPEREGEGFITGDAFEEALKRASRKVEDKEDANPKT